MVARPDLLQPAGERFAETVAEQARPGRTARTKATGVVHLGDAGDVTWEGGSLKDSLATAGWQPHGGTLASGITVVSALEWLLQGDVVYWRGRMYMAAGWAQGTNSVITGLPAAICPTVTMPLVVSLDSAVDGVVRSATARVTPGGELQDVAQAGSGSAWPFIGGSYRL